jgi:hypothetical protein
LATKKIFEICEDIRHYLTLSNVIILMAMDYEQMTYAIYQSYLYDYKELCNLQQGINIEQKCYEMATRYLEKLFPEGRRIVLPDFNAEITENKEDITFHYVDICPGKKEDILDSSLGKCSNVQEQLLKLIYLRTGVVFLAKQGEMHPFVPHTLRELTHMLKMLCAMHDIECDKVYLTGDGLNELKGNLSTLKHYFMDYWCLKNLQSSQMELLKEIDKANQNLNNKKICKYLYQYIHKEQEPSDEMSYISYQAV